MGSKKTETADETIDGGDTTLTAEPDHHLVVVHPFDGFNRGDKITNAEQITAILAGEKHRHVHKTFPG